jgi:hypothetical protein
MTGRSRGAKLRIPRGTVSEQIQAAREDAELLVDELAKASEDPVELTVSIHRAENIAALLRVVRARVKAGPPQAS